MREIKFRAWDRVQQKWIYITLPQGDISWAENPEWSVEDLEPWRQFTGLKDKNGVEIYEGDILATENDGKDGADVWPLEIMGVVEWRDDRAAFAYIYDDDPESMYSDEYAFVLGNEHENPELLK